MAKYTLGKSFRVFIEWTVDCNSFEEAAQLAKNLKSTDVIKPTRKSVEFVDSDDMEDPYVITLK